MVANIYELKDNVGLYDALGVAKDATEKEIRRAYYKLAVVYHPDKNPQGEEIFKEVTFAYNILADPQQRELYDRKQLKNHLQGRAKEYDPAMDPTVELSQEDLRKFVEKLRETHQSKEKTLSDFELKREEEMRRRAEYDAKNPAFKAEYERQRDLRRRGAAQQARAEREKESQAVAVPSSLTFRTSAEMMKNLQEDERRRMYGERVSSPTRRSAKLTGIKANMMNEYRVNHDSVVPAPSRGALTRTDGTEPEFVRQHQQVSAYSATVEDTIQQYKNYDYLDVVMKEKDDRVAMDGAILADALTQYDRRN